MEHENTNSTITNTLLNTDVASVFVVQNSRKRPFIEQFEHTSVNFTQKALGTMLGFFIVRDESSTSENIVNFLASEVKKQYFSPTEKPIEEKFESSLHRINRALEEIANLGNVSWLGTVEGAVCVISGHTIHFSVAGNAHIFLLRGDTLVDISEGLASEEAAHYPLKTFVDISSGDVCAHDKIIITSHELIELISFDELQKNAVRMGEKNFIQFIDTVLTNECTIASATIIDITEVDAPTVPHERPEERPVPENFFGADAFAHVQKEITPPEHTEINTETASDPPKEYTDPRTGHIHIHGDDELPESPTFFDTLSEKFTDAKEHFTETAQKKIRTLTKKITSYKKDTYTTPGDTTEHTADSDYTIGTTSTPHDPDDTTQEAQSADTLDTTNKPSQERDVLGHCKTYARRAYTTAQCAARTVAKRSAQLYKDTRQKIADARQNAAAQSSEENTYSYSYSQELPTEKDTKKRRILPHITTITHAWHSMDKRTRLTTLGLIAFMVIVPLLLSFFSRTAQKETTPTEPTTHTESTPAPPTEPQDTQKHTTSATIPDPITLHTTTNARAVFVLRDTYIGVESATIHIFGDATQSFPLPDSAGKIMHATAMDDLNMIFFITDTNALYTFSPVAKKYTLQTHVPHIDHKKIRLLSTFMTYLYTLEDQKITRHTRIEGGFDDGKKWLKKDTDFSHATSFAINDDIFITQKGTLMKFTKGKKDRYTADAQIAHASQVYTTEDMKFVWVLDTENHTLYKTKKDNGAVIDTYTHDVFATTQTFAIDEKNQKALITTDTAIAQIPLTQ